MAIVPVAESVCLTTLGILLRLKLNIMYFNQTFTGKHSLQNMVDRGLCNVPVEAFSSTYSFHLRGI